MVVIKLELWPGGNEKRAKPLGEIRIANDASGSAEYGNYTVEAGHAGRYAGRPGVYKRGRVTGFCRGWSPYRLLYMALKAIGEIT